MLTFMQSLSNYKATRPEDATDEYQKLIIECDTYNVNVATNLREYSIAVDKRSKAFLGKEKTTVIKLLSPIVKAIARQYDKTYKEYSSVVSITNKMRSQKVEKAIINPTEEKKDSISRAELSYGSMLQNFKDLIATLTVFQTYAPVNPDITLGKLNELVKELELLNTDVNVKIAPLNITRDTRASLFDDLAKRTQRIKSTISSLYGNTSVEYKQVKSLKI
jgi:hypothetical protein